MKTKQLANVLIKILGVWFSVNTISSILQGLVFFVVNTRGGRPLNDYWVYSAMSTMVVAAVGIYLMVNSRGVAEFLFKGENE